MKYVILIFSLICIYPYASYSNNIDIKAEVSNVICNLNNTIIYFDFFIKKSPTSVNNLYLENQNYRFSFDSQTLENGSFFIESEGELLSGVNFNSAGYYLFSEHNLEGSQENILSYNIDYLGGNSHLFLEDQWVKVGTVGATLLSNMECLSADFLTSSSFPPTTFVYNTQNENRVVDQEPSTFNISLCIDSYCQSCPVSLVLAQNQNNYISDEIIEHKVSNYIEAENIIGGESKITYNISNYSVLKPGFEIHKEATLNIKLEGCQN